MTMMMSVQFNNQGVVFLRGGFRKEASMMFAGALDILLQASQWQVQDGAFRIRETLAIGRSKNILETNPQVFHLSNHGAMTCQDKALQDIICNFPELNLLFAEAICLEHQTSAHLSDDDLALYSAAVIFNKALAGYHLAAYDGSVITCSQKGPQHRHLTCALQLYEKVNQILMEAQPELPYGRTLHLKLLMVCSNNIAHLHIEMAMHGGLLAHLDRLAAICLHSDGEESNGLKEELLLNCTVMKAHRCAATA
eukprot:CAMPEP_0195293762 /NCGR_PEP_ID=MMETSP0707-20130614/13290_1 /TAXON_ID=33640 /ORGANISM="Asterionellopsis glacialis, Strain CCMP134" /LENGTH=251 /DNA_ID=CAMNT_0040354553 /DNA_START=34 /DNA_END=789 /DNA_ORIENTATION=+